MKMTRLLGVHQYVDGEARKESSAKRLNKLNGRKSSADPHIPPSSIQLSQQETPILYLPPLLSPLPPGYRNGEPEQTSYIQTHLPDIDPVSLSLHKALHSFKPVDDAYAAKSYVDAFNWEEIGSRMDQQEEREWYVVAFRSRRKAGSNGLRE